ncbi:uncharacterized protein LOC126903324 [Daktulosphaira vitifoliae]|uniref:uncharacterized protein LOC126903324 n=1 Tax=Daktulosphaira vitifoliae TaxID=58002 RepID=UPI0021AAD0D3|nr:uncharacterized protein LOC126903324 [Daktulosphaira vitifoliae]
MDEITEEIDRVVHVLDVLKSRYILLRVKYDVGSNFHKKDSKEMSDATNDLQSYVMLDLYLLNYAFTYGLYSMNMYATRARTTLKESDSDPHFLKILKEKVQCMVETTQEIQNSTKDCYSSFTSYINSLLVYTNLLYGMTLSDSIKIDQIDNEKKKKKLMKKISKINLMANIIQFLVSDKIMDYRIEEGRDALNMALKYRTPRTLEYYSKNINNS